jgi:probable phosphoglycerate mutase
MPDTIDPTARAVPSPSRPPVAEPVSEATGFEPPPTELLLIRHGEKAPVTPEDPDPPLTPEGERQAQLLASRLAKLPLDAVYSSVMLRARQTASPIGEAHGLEAHTLAGLQEVQLGEWAEGGFSAHAAARDEAWRAFAKAGRWDVIPGSEGDAAFRTRVQAAIDEIATAHRGQRVAVVCHGGVINAALAEVLSLERSFWFPVEHTSVSIITGAGRNWFPRLVNDCGHLYDPAGMAAPVSP